MKYTLIKKHTYALVKAIEKFHRFILGKQTEIKVPFPVIFIFIFLSQTLLLGKLAHWIINIQEHDFIITTTNTIKGHDVALYLVQHAEPSHILKMIMFLCLPCS
jgi:hypothetical protein